MEEEGQKEIVDCERVSFALLQGDSLCLSGRSEWYIDFRRSRIRFYPIHGHNTCLHDFISSNVAIADQGHFLFPHSDFSTTQSDHRLSPKLSHSRANHKSPSIPTEATIDPELPQNRCIFFSIEDNKTRQEEKLILNIPYPKGGKRKNFKDNFILNSPYPQGGDEISPAFASINPGVTCPPAFRKSRRTSPPLPRKQGGLP